MDSEPASRAQSALRNENRPGAIEERRSCPICSGSNTQIVGKILHPIPAKVAGVTIDLQGRRFDLLRCPNCQFQFKDPPISAKELLACYEQAQGSHWSESGHPHRRLLDVVGDMLRRNAPPGHRILDIGCFTASLLDHLGPRWQRFGVEPSREAAAVARSRGVDILAATVGDLPDTLAPFDAVLAIDLLEHIVDPMPLLRRIHRLLRPGGVFLAVTGNTASPTWRIQKSRYWYCSLPEHVSFYSPVTMGFAGGQLGWRIVECRRLSHVRAPLHHRIAEAAKNAGYMVSLAARGFGIAPLRRSSVERRAPTWITARDHMYVTMQRGQRARCVNQVG